MLTKSIQICALCGIMSAAFLSTARAFEGSLVAAHLVGEGKSYYLQGQYPQAIHEFGKALLVDPNNEEAQFYLAKMGTSTSFLRGQGEQVVKNIEWYQRQLAKVLQDKVDDEKMMKRLITEKKKLDDLVANKEAENEQLQKKVSEVQKYFRNKAAQDRALLTVMEDQMEKKNEAITCLNNELCTVKDTLVTKVALLEEKDKKLVAMDQKVADVEKESRRQAAQDQALINNIERLSEIKGRQIERLHEDLSVLKDHLEVQAKDGQAKAEKVQNLSAEVRSLEKALNTTESRWSSTRANYDRSIRTLQSQIDQQIRQKAAAEERHNKDLTKLQKTITDKQNEIKQKNDKLASTNQQLAAAHKELDARKRMIVMLQQSLSSLDEELTRALSRNKEEMAQETVEDIRDNVRNLAKTRFLEREDKAMEELKAKLAAVRTQIADIERADNKKADLPKLLELKEKLTEVKVQLKERGELWGGQNSIFELLSNRLRDTEERLDVVVKDVQARDSQVKEIERQLNSVLTQAEK